MPARAALLVIALPLLGTGCYTFESASLGTVQPGMELRARLSAGGAQSVADRTGASRETVGGTVVRLPPDTLVLSVWRTDLIVSTFEPGRIELPLESAQIVSVEEKRLSVLRTGGVAAALGGGLYFLIRALFGGAGGILLGDDDGGI